MISRMGTWGVAALVAAFMVSFAGCEPRKSVVPVIKIDPAAAAAKAMDLYDADKDGKISGAELDKAPSIKSALDLMGTDAAKGVAADRISARVQKWAADKNGMVPVLCFVTRNGAPLAGADVKFVPDPCIADYLKQSGEGKTDSSGWAKISLHREPGSDMPPAIPPGFYRVEITKSGENIPAQYNTATTLGQEISSDGLLKLAQAQKKIQFELKY